MSDLDSIDAALDQGTQSSRITSNSHEEQDLPVTNPASLIGRSWTSSIAKQTYTVLAWVDGHDGGVLFVKTGPGVLNLRTGDGRNDQCWMTVGQWDAWIETYGAKPKT